MKKILSLVAVAAMVVTLVSVAAFSASAASTKVFKFTFEDENAESILKKGGVAVGEIVEWPEGSGNHCLRYEMNAETRTGAGGAHPYIWPAGLGGALVVQGELDDTGSEIELKVDFACGGSTQGSYMYPFILFNGEEENYADHSVYAPGSGKFNTGTFNWSSYEVGAPINGEDNGGICFCDEVTLPEGAYMYVDNIEFNWVGEWQDVDGLFIGYQNGTPCEESDLEMGAMETEVVPTATEPAPTEAEPTEAEPTATEPVVTEPTEAPTEAPTKAPTKAPTEKPTVAPTEAPTQPEVLLGDANGDNVVNMKDVLMLRKNIAGIAADGFNSAAADFNQDGSINMKDVLGLRKQIAGIK